MTFGRQAGHKPVRRHPGGAPGRGPMPAPQDPPPGYAGHGPQAHGGRPVYGHGGHPPAHGGHPYGGAPVPAAGGASVRYGAPVPYGAAAYGAPSPGPSLPPGAPPPYGTPPGYGPPVRGQAPPAGPRRRREPRPASGPVTDEDERWAVPAYVGMFVGGLVAPAIVYFARGRSSPFARFHAVQALNLGIAMTVCNLVGYGLLYVIGFPGLFIALAAIAAECFCVVRAAIGANRCEWYRLPSLVAWPILR